MDQSAKLAFLNNLLDRELDALKHPINDDDQLASKIFGITSTTANPLKNNLVQQALQNQSDDDDDDDDEETPLKIKYEPKKNNPNSSKSQRDNSTGTRRVNKFRLERSIEQAETQLNDSLKKKPSKSSRHTSQECDKITRKVSQIRHLQDHDRQVLLREKNRNKELLVELETLNKKMKKMQLQIDRTNQLEQDYRKLQDNFEKSEFIRNQQKNLIINLKIEISSLKSEKGIQDENSFSKGPINQKKKPSRKQ